MTTRVQDGCGALTEKEKQTLRLMVRGHDAKSIARTFGLSVHTINERLREARRKLAVSSSREAARLLLEVEGGTLIDTPPIASGDAQLGEDAGAPLSDAEAAPVGGAGRANRSSRIIVGVCVMFLVLGLATLALLPQAAPAPPPTAAAATPAASGPVVDAARNFLTLVDQSRWEDSYLATGTSFQKLNTLKVWSEVSDKVRVPLGAVVSRTVLSQENLPAPPSGYEVVKFRTAFANRSEAIETVTLDREARGWVVVGITIG